MKFFRKLPVPVTGVMLGCASLGNLLQSYGEVFHEIFGITAVILGILFLIKVIAEPADFRQEMKNPVTASVSGTFSMALMLLAGYAKPFSYPAAVFIWYTGILLHIILIFYFTVTFLFRLQIKNVFASYFIVYVGIVTASVTAPAFHAHILGAVFFWFGFISLIPLFLLVTIRYLKYKDVPEQAKPLFCIYTAPVSLCIAGCIQSSVIKNPAFLLVMLGTASVIYLVVLIRTVGFLKLKFYPSYASFTFPFVISAIAARQMMLFLTKANTPVPWLAPAVTAETAIAAVLVLYTLIRFIFYAASTVLADRKDDIPADSASVR